MRDRKWMLCLDRYTIENDVDGKPVKKRPNVPDMIYLIIWESTYWSIRNNTQGGAYFIVCDESRSKIPAETVYGHFTDRREVRLEIDNQYIDYYYVALLKAEKP